MDETSTRQMSFNLLERELAARSQAGTGLIANEEEFAPKTKESKSGERLFGSTAHYVRNSRVAHTEDTWQQRNPQWLVRKYLNNFSLKILPIIPLHILCDIRLNYRNQKSWLKLRKLWHHSSSITTYRCQNESSLYQNFQETYGKVTKERPSRAVQAYP
ncbi:unnamed protein product [Cylicocyclus nassatus]|uniref:Uncharacterized protein n=1 Tax=Cylicocyclus nassatus TaxID=53992 RepID=A0AA36HGX8_CYLNA|nr:unnamed protein product [Cylicocyclus nassatus]